MKTLFTSTFIIAAFALNAQTSGLKKACLKMEKDENGKVTKIDTCVTAATEEELQQKINALGFGDMPAIPEVPSISAVPPVPPVPPVPGKGKEITCTKMIVIEDEDDGGKKTGNERKVKVVSSGSATGDAEMIVIDKDGNITRTKLGDDDKIISGSDSKVIIRQLKPGEKMDPEVEKFMYEYKMEDGKTEGKQIIIKNENNKDGKTSSEVKVFVFSKVKVEDLSESDKKQLPAKASKAIQNAKPFDHLSVSPNPTEDACSISYKSVSNEPLEVKVYNVEGKTVLTETETNSGNEVNKTISLKALGKGIYFVHLTQGNQSEIKKVIVK